MKRPVNVSSCSSCLVFILFAISTLVLALALALVLVPVLVYMSSTSTRSALVYCCALVCTGVLVLQGGALVSLGDLALARAWLTVIWSLPIRIAYPHGNSIHLNGVSFIETLRVDIVGTVISGGGHVAATAILAILAAYGLNWALRRETIAASSRASIKHCVGACAVSITTSTLASHSGVCATIALEFRRFATSRAVAIALVSVRQRPGSGLGALVSARQRSSAGY